jgi:hypothetical protein
MKTIPRVKLQKQYEFSCNEYVKKFSNKHGYEFSGWVGEEVGGIAVFIEQYFFNISDIVYDINHMVAKGKIIEWQEYNLQNTESINFRSFIKGYRHEN